MTKEILVAIWNQAPFQTSIVNGIEILNKHLELRNIPINYEPLFVSEKKPKMAHIFILDGGEDICPERYGETNEHSYFSVARDDAEFLLANFYNKHSAKMSGVCRGHQLLNVFFGGTLWQDIRRAGLVADGDNHSSGHKVYIEGKSRNILPAFVGTNVFTVSSLHHQSIKKYGSTIRPSLLWKPARNRRRSYHSRYVVEGIESVDGRIRGLQSHPEFRGYPKDGQLFAYLMHVDSFTREFVKPDMKKIADRYGRQNNINYHTVDSQPDLPRPVSRRDLGSFAERYARIADPTEVEEEDL